MGCTEQCRRAGEDRRKETVLVAPVEERERGVVEGTEIRIGQPRVEQAAVGFDEVERAVGDRDELVLGPAVIGIAGNPGADRDRRAGVRGTGAGPLADRSPDPVGHVVSDETIRTRQQRRELISAVAIEPIVVPRGARHHGGDVDQERVARRVALGVVETLEIVEVEHQQGERSAALDGRAELALERAVVPQPGQGVLVRAGADLAVRLGVLHRDRCLAREQLRELELVRREMGLAAAEPPDVQRPDRVTVDQQGDDHHRLGFERRVRHLNGPIVEVGIVGEDRLAVLDDPAGESVADGPLVREDLLGEAVAGDDRTAGAPIVVRVIDGQRVVRDDRLE